MLLHAFGKQYYLRFQYARFPKVVPPGAAELAGAVYYAQSVIHRRLTPDPRVLKNVDDVFDRYTNSLVPTQDLTVCVIRDQSDFAEQLVGRAYLHPEDQFEKSIGRYLAYVDALAELEQSAQRVFLEHFIESPITKPDALTIAELTVKKQAIPLYVMAVEMLITHERIGRMLANRRETLALLDAAQTLPEHWGR